MKILFDVETEIFSNDEIQDGNLFIGFRPLPASIEGFTFGYTLLKDGAYYSGHQWPKSGQQYVETDQDYVESVPIPDKTGSYQLIINVNELGYNYQYAIE